MVYSNFKKEEIAVILALNKQGKSVKEMKKEIKTSPFKSFKMAQMNFEDSECKTPFPLKLTIRFLKKLYRIMLQSLNVT